jgi:hypothetical protein
MPPKEYDGFPQTGQRIFAGGTTTSANLSLLILRIELEVAGNSVSSHLRFAVFAQFHPAMKLAAR